MTQINPERVNEIFLQCLFKPEEIVDGKPTMNYVAVEGIMQNFGFHPERLQSNAEEVKEMLTLLPKQFMKSGGGGWTFLNACNQEDGHQWTGLHQRMEQLFCLGIGLKLSAWQMPKDMWSGLPGGMPYVIVNL